MEQNATAGRVQVHAHVEPEVRAELAAVARVNDRSLAAEIRQAIAEHVSKESASAAATTSGTSAAEQPPSAQGDYLVQQDQAQEREWWRC